MNLQKEFPQHYTIQNWIQQSCTNPFHWWPPPRFILVWKFRTWSRSLPEGPGKDQIVQSEMVNHKTGNTLPKSLSAQGSEQLSIYTPQQPGCFLLQSVKGLGRQKGVRIWHLWACFGPWTLLWDLEVGSPDKKPSPTPLLLVHVCPTGCYSDHIRCTLSLASFARNSPSTPLLLPDTEGTYLISAAAEWDHW